jgi:threonine synthase
VVSDVETFSTIKAVFETYRYVLDPHAAVAYKALQDHLFGYPGQKGFILGTAHPVKFPTVVQEAIGYSPAIPQSLCALMKKIKTACLIPPEYASFKSILLKILKKYNPA